MEIWITYCVTKVSMSIVRSPRVPSSLAGNEALICLRSSAFDKIALVWKLLNKRKFLRLFDTRLANMLLEISLKDIFEDLITLITL